MEKSSEQWSASLKSEDEQFVSNNSDENISSPPYSETEAKALEKKLVNKETFKEAQKILITWLQEGQCNKENAEHFISLIQLCRDHFDKLQKELKEFSEEAQNVKESVINKNRYIQVQLEEIEQIFSVVAMKNIWSNLTENQIKEIQEMLDNISDFKKDILRDSTVVKEEESSGVINSKNEDVLTENNLACGINTNDQDLKTRCNCEKEILKLNSELEESRKRKKIAGDKKIEISDVASHNQISERESSIVCAVSVFLYPKPEGVNIVTVQSYLNKFIPDTCTAELENLMRRLPKIFKESSPIGAAQETKWTYISVKPGSLSEYLNK